MAGDPNLLSLYAKANTDLRTKLARAEKVIEAARDRIAQGHNDTCGKVLVSGAPCDCGHDALVLSLTEYGRHLYLSRREREQQ